MVTVQNRIALDLVLAAQGGGGGACVLLRFECCTYISDKSECIASLAEKIKAEEAKFHNYSMDNEIVSWLKGIFGRWETRLLQWIFMGLILPIIIIVLFKCTTTHCQQ